MPEFQSGQRIDHYTLLEHIGSGGFGEVWKAQDNMLDGRIVALKFILKTVGAAETEQDLLREQRSISKLTTNRDRVGASNILYINAAIAGTDKHPPFLDLEWMAGGTLADHLNGDPSGHKEVLRIASQLTDALVCANSHKIIHCDIKPSNVLLSENRRRYCLSDFGLARKVGELESDVWGTPPYMSPEQFRQPETVDSRTDVYSLGVLLYQCAEGTLPFVASTGQRQEYEDLHCSAKVPEMQNSQIQPTLQKIIKDCLRKDKEDRPDPKVLRNRLSEINEDVKETWGGPPPVNLLEVIGSAERKYVRHIYTGTELQPVMNKRLYVPSRPISNKDYYRFINDNDHLHWKPGVVSVSRHDGGYLQHWFMGRPLQDDFREPVVGMPYDAAEEMAAWYAGRLPTADELQLLFFSDEGSKLAEQYNEYMEDHELKCLQFWCRDNSITVNSSMRKMWVYMPESDMAGNISEISRPKYYCFPHYTFVPVVPRKHVNRSAHHDIIEASGVIPPVQHAGVAGKGIGSMKKSHVHK